MELTKESDGREIRAGELVEECFGADSESNAKSAERMTEAGASVLQEAQVGNGEAEEHILVVLQHGILASSSCMENMQTFLKDRLESSKRSFSVVMPTVVEGTKTLEGIDTCGLAVADCIMEKANSLNRPLTLLYIGHSLGGLIGRYAITELFARGFFGVSGITDGVRPPLNDIAASCGIRGIPQWTGPPVRPWAFSTFATPHLSSRTHFPWNTIGAQAMDVTGSQLVMIDEHHLMLEMSRGLFLTALGSFERRLAFANARADKSVPFFTSNISLHDPYLNLPAEKVKTLNDFPHIVDPDYQKELEDIGTHALQNSSGNLKNSPVCADQAPKRAIFSSILKHKGSVNGSECYSLGDGAEQHETLFFGDHKHRRKTIADIVPGLRRVISALQATPLSVHTSPSGKRAAPALRSAQHSDLKEEAKHAQPSPKVVVTVEGERISLDDFEKRAISDTIRLSEDQSEMATNEPCEQAKKQLYGKPHDESPLIHSAHTIRNKISAALPHPFKKAQHNDDKSTGGSFSAETVALSVAEVAQSSHPLDNSINGANDSNSPRRTTAKPAESSKDRLCSASSAESELQSDMRVQAVTEYSPNQETAAPDPVIETSSETPKNDGSEDSKRLLAAFLSSFSSGSDGEVGEVPDDMDVEILDDLLDKQFVPTVEQMHEGLNSVEWERINVLLPGPHTHSYIIARIKLLHSGASDVLEYFADRLEL